MHCLDCISSSSKFAMIPELLSVRGFYVRDRSDHTPCSWANHSRFLRKLKDEEFNIGKLRKGSCKQAGRIQLKQSLNLDYTEDAYTVGSFRLAKLAEILRTHQWSSVGPFKKP
ncbi:hypothetical protein AVEN_152908-1 [Araneus ventricosus]|uniref:Uncharacterized protein n=1 Tax=Araneus ventricosus TaxID=182803 RepID=A0A4Y2AFG2_ARAVE|nr:hypothetical protein AVEN_152908-1 [Araneus ventricosus]